MWIERSTIPRWPFLAGKPMVFIHQVAVPETEITQSKLSAGAVLYIFGARKPVDDVPGGWEMVYRIVEQVPMRTSRKSVGSDPPISHGAFRDLFEHLDGTSATGYQCDHTFAMTEKFLRERGLPVESMIEWLGANGAGCDCEVMLNAAPQWERIVGYEAPHE